MTTQINNLSAFASGSLAASTSANRGASSPDSIEQQFLSMIEESLAKLGLSKDQVDVRMESEPRTEAKAAQAPRLVVSIARPAVEDPGQPEASTPRLDFSSLRSGSPGAAATSAAVQTPPPPSAFLASFRPEYEEVTSTIVDVTARPIGSVILNPYHFATESTAQLLAQKLGATVVTDGAMGRTTPERQLQFSEGGQLLNAGLVARAFQQALERGESEETVIQRLQAELTQRT